MAGNSILVINAAGAETRVALIESGTIHEYYLERKREKGIVGNIYKGRVVRVLPGMQAAFVDIGLEKAAFLYVGDVYGDPDFSEEFELTEGEHSEQVPEVPSEQEAEEQEVKALAGEAPGADAPAAEGATVEVASAEPVADFFDALAVGDGEDVVHEITDVVMTWKGSGEDRAGLHRRLARVPGVYVPSLFAPRFDPATGALLAMDALEPGYERVVRRVVPDIDTLSTSAYEHPVVPFMQTVHDRLPIELQRGCTRGCRFCQVGMITRPTRQRSPETVLRVAEQGLQAPPATRRWGCSRSPRATTPP